MIFNGAVKCYHLRSGEGNHTIRSSKLVTYPLEALSILLMSRSHTDVQLIAVFGLRFIGSDVL